MSKKAGRTLRFSCTKTAYGVFGTLTITQRGQVDTYDVESLGSPDPEQVADFRVTKQGGEEYVCRIDVARGFDHDCQCKGFTHWKRCRHVEAIARLISLGKI